MNKLREIFDRNHCDKGTNVHCYDRVYHPMWEHIREHDLNILEIGVFKGESLQSWVEYFPNATINGIDVFTLVGSDQIPALNHPRVKWANCDSTDTLNSDVIAMAENGENLFDIIIDDGCHTHEAQRKTFLNFIELLSDDGVYIIEDLWPYERIQCEEAYHPWMNKVDYDLLLETLEPYNVTYHDISDGYAPDTFLVEIRK